MEASPRRRDALALRQAGQYGVQVYRVGHGAVAFVARMQVVARVEARRHACRVGAVAQHGVEVDDGIEGAAQPYPCIHLPPLDDYYQDGKVAPITRRPWLRALATSWR